MAPNLSALIGELVGARLISHAGSLTNLAKYPVRAVELVHTLAATCGASWAQGRMIFCRFQQALARLLSSASYICPLAESLVSDPAMFG